MRGLAVTRLQILVHGSIETWRAPQTLILIGADDMHVEDLSGVAGAECKGSGESGEMGQETRRAWKMVRHDVGEFGSNVTTIRDPLDALGADVVHSHVLPLLDARSLARCATLSSRWRSLAAADKLWQPLLAAFLAQRAHLPLCLMGRDLSSSACKGQKRLYTVAVLDSRQRDLLPAEMCGRTWELRLKPPCGPYWLGHDPTQVGRPGLRRYFHCDGSITAGPNDPIWGGQESVWEYVHLEDGDGEVGKHVQINRWPPLTPRRVKDGRWVLENFYGLYITRPDNPAFSTKRYSEECKGLCRTCCSPSTYGVKI